MVIKWKPISVGVIFLITVKAVSAHGEKIADSVRQDLGQRIYQAWVDKGLCDLKNPQILAARELGNKAHLIVPDNLEKMNLLRQSYEKFKQTPDSERLYDRWVKYSELMFLAHKLMLNTQENPQRWDYEREFRVYDPIYQALTEELEGEKNNLELIVLNESGIKPENYRIPQPTPLEHWD